MIGFVFPFVWYLAVGVVAWILYYKYFKGRKPGQKVTFTGPEMTVLAILLIYIGVNIGMVAEVLIIASLL
jgi:hypothetical protein